MGRKKPKAHAPSPAVAPASADPTPSVPTTEGQTPDVDAGPATPESRGYPSWFQDPWLQDTHPAVVDAALARTNSVDRLLRLAPRSVLSALQIRTCVAPWVDAGDLFDSARSLLNETTVLDVTLTRAAFLQRRRWEQRRVLTPAQRVTAFQDAMGVFRRYAGHSRTIATMQAKFLPQKKGKWSETSKQKQQREVVIRLRNELVNIKHRQFDGVGLTHILDGHFPEWQRPYTDAGDVAVALEYIDDEVGLLLPLRSLSKDLRRVSTPLNDMARCSKKDFVEFTTSAKVETTRVGRVQSKIVQGFTDATDFMGTVDWTKFSILPSSPLPHPSTALLQTSLSNNSRMFGDDRLVGEFRVPLGASKHATRTPEKMQFDCLHEVYSSLVHCDGACTTPVQECGTPTTKPTEDSAATAPTAKLSQHRGVKHLSIDLHVGHAPVISTEVNTNFTDVVSGTQNKPPGHPRYPECIPASKLEDCKGNDGGAETTKESDASSLQHQSMLLESVLANHTKTLQTLKLRGVTVHGKDFSPLVTWRTVKQSYAAFMQRQHPRDLTQSVAFRMAQPQAAPPVVGHGPRKGKKEKKAFSLNELIRAMDSATQTSTFSLTDLVVPSPHTLDFTLVMPEHLVTNDVSGAFIICRDSMSDGERLLFAKSLTEKHSVYALARGDGVLVKSRDRENFIIDADMLRGLMSDAQFKPFIESAVLCSDRVRVFYEAPTPGVDNPYAMYPVKTPRSTCPLCPQQATRLLSGTGSAMPTKQTNESPVEMMEVPTVLTTLDVSGCRLDGAAFGAIAAIPTLRHLTAKGRNIDAVAQAFTWEPYFSRLHHAADTGDSSPHGQLWLSNAFADIKRLSDDNVPRLPPLPCYERRAGDSMEATRKYVHAAHQLTVEQLNLGFPFELPITAFDAVVPAKNLESLDLSYDKSMIWPNDDRDHPHFQSVRALLLCLPRLRKFTMRDVHVRGDENWVVPLDHRFPFIVDSGDVEVKKRKDEMVSLARTMKAQLELARASDADAPETRRMEVKFVDAQAMIAGLYQREAEKAIHSCVQNGMTSQWLADAVVSRGVEHLSLREVDFTGTVPVPHMPELQRTFEIFKQCQENFKQCQGKEKAGAEKGGK